MRPNRLTMTAFGPYRDQETIDYLLLEDRRLFVISGMTGAGKTSIFDAISYALYGAASGEDRADVRMLRSHFADEDVHTSVDFHFTVGKRSYRVFRQMGHRKGSNKSETGAKIELYETTSGQDVPCLDKFTVPEVNAKLESIIGLTREQFSQIVMLPQGEFRKLLTSDTENKEDILRRIFRTERFQQLEGRFYERSRQLKEAHKEAHAKLSIHMQHADETLPKREDSALTRTYEQDVYNAAQVLEGLELEEAYYTMQIEMAELRRTEISGKLDQLEREHRTASEGNRLFTELSSRRTRLQELEQQQQHMERLERHLQLAELAARIQPYDDYAVQARRETEQKRTQLEAKQQEVTEATLRLEQAKAAYEQENARSEERLQLELGLNRLHELKPAVMKLDDMQREVTRLEAEKATLAAQQLGLDQQLQESRLNKKAMTEQVDLLEAEASQLPEQERELERLRHTVRLLQELVQLDRQMREYTDQEKLCRSELLRIREEHDRIEAAWIEGQASMLAAHLHDGRPCPVCGSVDHPAKAVKIDDLPSREMLMERKEQLRLAEQELHAASAQAAAARSGWTGKSDVMEEYGIEAGRYDQQLQDIILLGKQAAQTTEQLKGKAAQLAQLRKQLQAVEQRIEQQSGERERTALAYQGVAVQLSKESTLLSNELARIPDHLRTPDKLAKELAAHETRLRTLTDAWNTVQQELQSAEKRLVEVTAQVDGLMRESLESAAKAQEAMAKFAAELAKAGFDSEDSYKQAMMLEADRLSAKHQLDEYRQAIQIVREQIAELERLVQGREIVDLDQLESSILTVKRELEENAAERQRAERFRQDAERIRRSIEQASSRVRQLEDELEQILDIYQALKGDNALKMSFERYILIDYLEQILQAANERLSQLSNGQYLLVRSDRLEARGRQSGLGLDVYDAYTGQNRDVKTLSGGEKFNASLALALGMTDVIQSHQGGVSIEMMFIDEGFGTLDEESLHKAVATLVDLQRAGRMIGVISHVAELKEAFPAVLEVIKTKEGYSRTKLTVK